MNAFRRRMLATSTILSRSISGDSKYIEQMTIDSFTQKPFGGNPAAVVFALRDTDWMQKLSNENNAGATAFIEQDPSVANTYNVRWFTATKELDLCGHGTLAAAHALYETKRVPDFMQRIYFKSLTSGTLSAIGRPDGTIQMDFPSTPSTKQTMLAEDANKLHSALGIKQDDVLYFGRTSYDLFVELKPAAFGGLTTVNYSDLEYFGGRGVIITCRGGRRLREAEEDQLIDRGLNRDTNNISFSKNYDYLCRFFMPRYGTNEDWATGSIQCALTPYWTNKFKGEGSSTSVESLVGYQGSMRGGTMYVAMSSGSGSEDRVLLAGHCVTTMYTKIIV